MTTTSTSTEDLVKTLWASSWGLFKKDGLILIAGAVVALILSIISLTILAAPLAVGYLKMIRKGLHGQKVQMGDIFSGMSNFLPALIALILISIAGLIGYLFFVLPGILVQFVTIFTFHQIAYHGMGPIEAITSSFDIVKNNFAAAIIIFILFSVLNLLGTLIPVLVIVSLPFSAILLTVGFEAISRHQKT